MTRTADRVLILGLDGATWTVLDPMRERGVMPNLSALLARSASGTLRSTVPPVTTAAWTTMMTGCDPSRHGVFDHRYYDAASGQMKVNHSGRARVPSVWRTLSDRGRSVAVLNLPGNFPPPKLRGVAVSGMDAPHLDAALSGDAEFAARMKAEVPDYSLRYFWKRAPLSLEELAENSRLTAESFLGRAKGGLLADQYVPDWSALMVQFQNLDPFQHRAWRHLNVDETGIDDRPWNDAAAEVLRGLDRAIGLLIELADRRGATILVCSDHGFGPCLGRVHANRILIDAGVARLPGTSGRVLRGAGKIVERVKLWNEKRGDRHARTASFDQSVAAQFPFDWKRTLAFAPHQDTAAMVYLNTAARHVGAPLTTARQIDDAREAARAALAGARHPETGTPLFPRIVETASAYGIDPAAEGYPDLIALPDEPFWVRTKLGPGRAWVESDANLPGTHRPEGIVALCGPGIAPGRSLAAELRDVTPTILALLGEPIPAHVEGTPLACVTTTARLDAPAPSIPAPHATQSFEYTPEEQAIIEQRLADLGYLE